MTTIFDLPTPSLLIDRERLESNLSAMAAKARALGVALRPHIKTHKCVEIARRQVELGASGITVSTLYEARVFADHGFDDVIWAFPLVPSRLPEVEKLSRRLRLGVVVDSREAVDLLVESDAEVDVWIKVDCGYHRAGVDPRSTFALDLARRLLDRPSIRFAGLLSHSGDAYGVVGDEAAQKIAEAERAQMVDLAERMRGEGVEVEGISVGSTPAMTRAVDLAGVTEARPGNYALFDHTQVILGSCTPADCAATVLASVVSAPPDGTRAVVDAGGLALSKEPSHQAAPHPTAGEIYEDYARSVLSPTLRVVSLSQEHGVLSAGGAVGDKVRILPNHSCLAIACFDECVVVEGDRVVDRWRIHRGR